MSDESKGLVKWKAALAVGVGAVALAGGALLAYYALTRSQRRARSEENAGETGTSTPCTSPPTTDGGKTNSGTTSQSTLERAQAIKQQGNEFYKQQKYEEAIKCYKEAISVCPVSKPADLAIFHQNLAAVYDVMAQKATDPDQKTSCLHQVLENCTRAFEHNPRYVKAMTRRLKVYEALGRRKEAILDVTRVLVLDESQGRALSQTVAKLLKDFGQLQATENFPKLGPLAPSKSLIKSYFQSFSWSDDLSESRLKQLWSTKTKPKIVEPPPEEIPREDGSELITSDQPEAQELTDDADFNEEPFVKAATAFREEKYHGILELLTEAITNGNAVFVAHALLLRGALNSLWRQGQKALKDLQDVVNTQGLSKEMYTNALVQRASMMALHGEMEKCHTCFTKALAIDPNCADVYIYRARLVLESEEQQSFTSTVVEDLEKGQSLAPTSPQAAYLLSSAYHRMAGMQQSMQLLETARGLFTEAIQKFPDFGDGLLLYAMFLQDANQVKEAQEILNKVIKLEPDNPIGHFTLGLTTLMVTQDIDRAVEHMETAIAKDNSCVQAYNTLATIEMQRNNSERAMDMYDKAISYSRSEAEMSQAYISREVVTAQNQACKEYGVTQSELASRAFGASGAGAY